MSKRTSYRTYSITKEEGKLYHAKVVDSYGNKYDNYFAHAHEANDWIYYVWEKEDWFNSANSQDLLANAIQQAHRLDQESGILKGNRDGLD